MPAGRSTSTIPFAGSGLPISVTKLQPQTLMRLNLGWGYILSENAQADWIQRLTGLFEVHWTSTLNDATINAILAFAVAHKACFYTDHFPGKYASERDVAAMAGQVIVNENYRAVNHRYSESEKPHALRYDPRAKVIKTLADQVFEVTGKTNPLLQVALELEKIALSDEYFVKRKLYPNVDFYSGLIYEALGIPVDMFPVMFAIPRTSGWLAQWEEMLLDKEQKIARPRQIYTGYQERPFLPMDKR